jgi:AcrR family transcriptional regulator
MRQFMPKIIDYEEKRLEIASDAIEVFAKKGYYQTNLKDIAKATGMGRTSLYKYFRNKDEIYYYIVKRAYVFFEEQVDRVLALDLPNLDRLERLLEYLVKNLDESIVSNRFLDFWMVIHRTDQELEDEIFRLSDQILNRVEMLLKRAKDAGEILPSINGKALASMLLAVVESLAILMGDETPTIDEYLETMHILLNGIKRKGIVK